MISNSLAGIQIQKCLAATVTGNFKTYEGTRALHTGEINLMVTRRVGFFQNYFFTFYSLEMYEELHF